jgi:RNA polymerase sigma factor (sigma-70 family)
MDDRDLLRDYVERQSEQAFAELVARHLPGVLATAQRLVREPQAAADVAQTVFIQLARKAWTIREGQVLSGWLYRTTRHAAFNALRLEQRRQQRETTAMKDADMPISAAPGWADLAPLVDEAMRQLKRPEQDVVLLRFFEGKSFAEIGRLLHLDEKTAGQRAHRALEKMRRYFSRRGVTTTALLLGSALGAHGAAALPAGMSAQVAGASLAGASGTTSYALLLKTLYMTTSTKLILAAAILVTAATVFTVSQQREIFHLRAELAVKNAGAGAAAKKLIQSPADRLAQAKAALAQALKSGSGFDRGRKVRDFAETLDVDTVKALLDDIIKKPLSTSNGNLALSSLVSRFAELNAPQAFIWMQQSIHDRIEKSECVGYIFDVWSGKDPMAALTAALTLKGYYTPEVYEIFGNFAQQNPQAALAAIHNLPVELQIENYNSIFEVWAGNDPSAAAAAALSLPPNSIRQGALLSVARSWAKQDPDGALAWVEALPASSIKNTAIASALDTMSELDPAYAANYTINLNLPAGLMRDNLLQRITATWAQTDPTAVLTWANTNLTGDAYDNAATQALDEISISDPASAVAALTQLSDPNVVNKVIPAIASNWANQDPQAALAWVQSLPTDSTDTRSSAIAAVLRGTNYDPVSAAAYIQQNFATDPAFNKLATQVVTSWSQSDPQAALTWAESLPLGEAQSDAVNAAITQLANVDPQTAWNDAQQLSGSAQDTAMVNVINAWVNQQPAQAAAALANLPQGADLATATGDVAKSWLSQNPNAASQWIDTLPQGDARDSAVTQLIASVSKNDPASAFNWAVTLGDPTARNTQVVALATQWSSNNPTAAAAAVQTALNNLTGLTPAQQTALQNIAAKAPAP